MASIKVVSFNCRTLCPNWPERVRTLEAELVNHNTDIAFLQETWFTPQQATDNNTFNEFNIFRSDRSGRGGRSKGGGTAIVVRKCIDAQVVPIGRIAELDKLEATAVKIKLSGGRSLFCVSVYNREESNPFIRELERVFDRLGLGGPNCSYIIGGDFNMAHVAWGYKKSTRPGTRFFDFCNSPSYGIRVLASLKPSYPLKSSFPDLFLIKDTVDVRPFEDDVVNCLDTVDVSFSDHRMIKLTCGNLSDEPLPLPPAEGRFGVLRRGIRKLKVDEFREHLHVRRDRYGLSEEEVDALATKSLTEMELNRVTESFTELLVDSMELSIPEQRPVVTPPLPSSIRELVREKKGLLRRLFRTYRWTRSNDPVAIESISEQRLAIAGVTQRIAKEWRTINWRKSMDKLDRVRAAQPSDFFRELKRVYQRPASQRNEEEIFLDSDDSDGNGLCI